jgi:hypothetical protein
VSGFSRTVDDVGPGFSRTVDTVVDLRRSPLRVAFYDARPSWASTFVRRALEADRRFDVSAISVNSRGISTRTGDALSLSDPRIDNMEAIVLGGLDRLAAADLLLLDRFMRERGGAVVLVPDMKVDADPARSLVPFTLAERLLERPATLAMRGGAATLQASELLVASALPTDHDVVATTPGADAAAVVISIPRGAGRLFVSGAMDAWRFRAADAGAFDRFWQSAIAGLAQAVPPAVDLVLEPPLLRPLERGGVVVRLRSRQYSPVVASVDGDPLRLLPDREPGVFRGTFVAKAPAGRSTVDIRSAPGQPALAARTVLVDADAHAAADNVPLAMLATSHGGIDVAPDQIGDVDAFLRRSIATPRTTVVRRPMRSGWWILPFAACLSAEWWLRRRHGLR